MSSICRIAKKYKITEGIYILKKLELQEGTIDKDSNFVIMNDEEIIKYPLYSDTEFLFSDNELCYCDDTNLETIIEESTSVSTKADLLKKYKADTDDTAYIIYYDKKTKTTESLIFNPEQFTKMVDLYFAAEEIEENKNEMFMDDDECFAYTKDYILTTEKTIKNLHDKLENEDVDTALDILESTLEDCKYSKLTYTDVDQVNVEELLCTPDESKNSKTVTDERTLDEIMSDLNNLIGINNIKKQVDKLSTYLKYLEKIKQNEMDINLEKPNLNMAFLGNPGTGKTTVARIISAILNKLGYANGKFKEVSAQDFIAEYVGQTAPKTEKLLKEIKGGVLFIDEAYSLTLLDSDASFGQEAIAVLLKEMEKNDTVFIFSGYKKEMEKFIKSNSGLTSRIRNYYEFNDYKTEELLTMFLNKLNKSKLVLGEGILDEIRKIIDNVTTQEDFGNGRFVDKLFDSIILEHGYNNGNSDNLEDLKTITLNDINKENIDQLTYKKIAQRKLGF